MAPKDPQYGNQRQNNDFMAFKSKFKPNCTHKKNKFFFRLIIFSDCTKNKLLQVDGFCACTRNKLFFRLIISCACTRNKLFFRLIVFWPWTKNKLFFRLIVFLLEEKTNIFNFRNHSRSKKFLHSFKGKFVYRAYHTDQLLWD